MRASKRDLFRLLDANANRAREACRVVEDLIRFISNDRRLTRRTKYLRHQITQQLADLPASYQDLLRSRNSKHDVGQRTTLYSSSSLSTVHETLIRNLKRTQESLRVLEEVAKMISRKNAEGFEKLRFESYELEKTIFRKF